MPELCLHQILTNIKICQTFSPIFQLSLGYEGLTYRNAHIDGNYRISNAVLLTYQKFKLGLEEITLEVLSFDYLLNDPDRPSIN